MVDAERHLETFDRLAALAQYQPSVHSLAVPPGLAVGAKRKLIRQISDTIGEACGRDVEEVRLPSGTTISNNWVLTFFWELPLDQVALGDLLATTTS
jgi:hypothetical protein